SRQPVDLPRHGVSRRRRRHRRPGDAGADAQSDRGDVAAGGATMKAPRFWARNAGGVMPALLSPLALLYCGASRLHRPLQRREQVDGPVVWSGDVVAGGAGRTPAAIAIARMFRAKGLRPHCLTRGYGGSPRGPVRVVPDVHKFAEVGDEALILAETAPTWVAKDRVAGAAAAATVGADVIIMDDGFQNPSLHKDFSIL